MAFDAHTNFAVSTVATAPSPATSGTSVTVASGDGAKFPAAPFNAVIWPTAAQPTSTTAEIVRVTAVSTDTFTITRTQESTSARTVVVGDQIMLAPTAKTFTDIEKLALGLPMFPQPHSGDYLISQFSNILFAGSGNALNDMYPCPIIIPATQTYNLISIAIASGVASSLYRFGIYADDGTGRPGALVADYGTVSGAANGNKSVAITYNGVAGTLIWAVCVNQGVLNASQSSFNLNSGSGATWLMRSSALTSATYWNINTWPYWRVTGVSGALPSTPTWVVGTPGNGTEIPNIGLVAA